MPNFRVMQSIALAANWESAMQSLTNTIDTQITIFVSQHQRDPLVLRLGAIHVQTLRACGACRSTDDWGGQEYNGIPIEEVQEALHLSLG
jgi:hypothetical protein